MDQIQQSDTWTLAPPDVRPWLLMMWAAAWGLTPSGSLPGDEAVLCARLGIAPKVFEKHKAILMRGWKLADDGRLYHGTITDLVLAMIEKRKTEAQRKAEYRTNKEAERQATASAETPNNSNNVPPMSHGTNMGRTSDSTRNPTLTTDHLPFNLVAKDKEGKGQDASPNGSDPPAKRKSPLTPLPENFSLSAEVVSWATSKGFGNLEKHLENFVCKAKAKDYRYADWDAAFKTAVRDDWLGDRLLKPGAKVTLHSGFKERNYIGGELE